MMLITTLVDSFCKDGGVSVNELTNVVKNITVASS